jgi:hypothetical protein
MTAMHVFRGLLLTQILLPIISRLIGSTEGSARPLASHFTHPNVFRAIAFIIIVADIAVITGLWRFRRWARVGAIVILLIVVGFAFSSLHPSFVTRGSFALMYIEHVITGILFAMMFLPPLSLEFAKR